AVRAEVRLYDHLFSRENPNDVEPGREFTDTINPGSLEVIRDARLEPGLAAAAPGSRYQFERLGYFCADAADHRPGTPVFNRTATLRDTWAKIQKKEPASQKGRRASA
nr:glutamine--tRNA ligase [Desulfobacterales bacterium]